VVQYINQHDGPRRIRAVSLGQGVSQVDRPAKRFVNRRLSVRPDPLRPTRILPPPLRVALHPTHSASALQTAMSRPVSAE